MLIATGTLLVLVSWALTALIIVSLGLPTALVAGRGASRSQLLRASLWWGLLTAAVLACLMNLVLPLQSATAGLLVIALALVAGVPGWILWRRHPRVRGSVPRLLVLGVIAVALALALAALGPVTNYDTGVYHLQAIRYAAEYATVPGLASVYFPLGYATAEFPLAALLGAGPWGMDGFRLLNGLIIMLALLDLLLRATERRRGAGFFVLLTGMSVVVLTMVPLADYWVTSPTQDSSVFVLTVVASAVLVDVITRRHWMPSATMVAAIALLLVMLRPTMVAFALGCAIVVVTVASRHRGEWHRTWRRGVPLIVGATGIVAVTMTARDVVLSGWLQYPLSIHAFDVPWLSPDPANPRAATLGAARDPEDLWNAARGWEWIPAWLSRLPQQWEFWASCLLALATVVMVVIAARRASLRGRALLLALLPSALATGFWWAFTPPSFRFAWGVVFTLATIPIGWALWRLALAGRPVLPRLAVGVGSTVLIVIALVTAVFRTDVAAIDDARTWAVGVRIPYAVATPPAGDVAVAVNAYGLEFRAPRTGDQCWRAFPTCSPQMLGTLRLRGEVIQQGYLP